MAQPKLGMLARKPKPIPAIAPREAISSVCDAMAIVENTPTQNAASNNTSDRIPAMAFRGFTTAGSVLIAQNNFCWFPDAAFSPSFL